ncbi:hypothetical protein EZS27_007062, partial [termite gut metagenome]
MCYMSFSFIYYLLLNSYKNYAKISRFITFVTFFIKKYYFFMRKVYYIYNPQTQTFDRLYPTLRQKMLTKLLWIFYMVGCVVLAFLVVHFVLRSPSEKELRMENNKLLAQYNILSHQLDDALEVLQD